MNHCPDNTEWVLYAAGEVDPDRRPALREHLDGCAACRAEVEAVQRGLEALAALDPAPAVRPQVMEAVRQRLASQRQTGRPTVLRLRRYRWVASAAAVVLAATLIWVAYPRPDRPMAAAHWVDDNHVIEELAELTAAVEMLEVGDFASASAENGTTPRKAPAKPSEDEVEQYLQELEAEISAQG